MSGVSLRILRVYLYAWLSQDTELYFISAPFTQLHFLCISRGKRVLSLSLSLQLGSVLLLPGSPLSRLAICTLYLGPDMIYMQLFYLLHTHSQSGSRRFFYIFGAVAAFYLQRKLSFQYNI